MTTSEQSKIPILNDSGCPDYKVKPVVADEEVSLDDLAPAQCAFVRRIEAPDDDASRLMVLGICIGRRVQLVRKGDPLIVRVLGSRLGLSARLAHRVIVASCQAPECKLHPHS